MEINTGRVHLSDEDIKTIVRKMQVDCCEGSCDLQIDGYSVSVSCKFEEATCIGASGACDGYWDEVLHDYYCNPYDIEMEIIDSEGENGWDYSDVDADSSDRLEKALNYIDR